MKDIKFYGRDINGSRLDVKDVKTKRILFVSNKKEKYNFSDFDKCEFRVCHKQNVFLEFVKYAIKEEQRKDILYSMLYDMPDELICSILYIYKDGSEKKIFIPYSEMKEEFGDKYEKEIKWAVDNFFYKGSEGGNLYHNAKNVRQEFLKIAYAMQPSLLSRFMKLFKITGYNFILAEDDNERNYIASFQSGSKVSVRLYDWMRLEKEGKEKVLLKIANELEDKTLISAYNAVDKYLIENNKKKEEVEFSLHSDCIPIQIDGLKGMLFYILFFVYPVE